MKQTNRKKNEALPLDKGSESSDAKRQQPLILTPDPPRAPQRHAPAPSCASHSGDVPGVVRAAFCGGCWRALWWHKERCEFCPWDPAVNVLCFQSPAFTMAPSPRTWEQCVISSSRKILASEDVGCCKQWEPASLRYRGMTLEAFWNPYWNLTQCGEKPELPEQLRENRRAAREIGAKRKGGFVLDLGRRTHNQVKTHKM